MEDKVMEKSKMDNIKEMRDYLYNELCSLESKDKHNRDLMRRKTNQLNLLLEMLDNFEEELTRYELMKNSQLKLNHIETQEYPL